MVTHLHDIFKGNNIVTFSLEDLLNNIRTLNRPHMQQFRAQGHSAYRVYINLCGCVSVCVCEMCVCVCVCGERSVDVVCCGVRVQLLLELSTTYC